MESLFTYVAPPSPCGYLPEQSWSLEYEYVGDITAAEYERRMQEGWRHFRRMLLHPLGRAGVVLLPRPPPRRRRLRRRPARQLLGHLLLLRPRPARPGAGHLQRAAHPRPGAAGGQGARLPRLLRRRLPVDGVQDSL